MFTGLIEDTGRVVSFERRGPGALLTVETSLPTGEIALGDSVAVNGICLTVTERGSSRLAFDVSSETVSRSTMQDLRAGVPVNLERALRMGDRLGGHIVTGHIDCRATLSALRSESSCRVLSFTLPREYCRYLVEKGSVAIDGISLTIHGIEPDGFSVTIIPHTLGHTTLASLKAGDRVNIETDILGKYVERLLAPASAKAGGLSMKTLAENGFL